MKKLTLDPESLRVESFAADDDAWAVRGTVEAHSFITLDVGPCSEPASQHCQPTDFHWNTCGVSCWYACFPTGPETNCDI
jgi:hypothetical protein